MSNRFLKSQTGMLNRLEKAQTVCTCKEDSSRASRDDPLPRVRRTSSRFAPAGGRRRGHGGRPGGVRRLSRRALASAPRTHAPRAARGTHQVRLTPFRAPWCARAPAGRALSWGAADRHCGPSAPVRRRPLQPRLRARGSSTGRGSGASEPVFGSAGPGEALLVCAQRETADAGRHTRQGCYARPVAVGHAACKSAAAACRAARQRARSCTWAGPKSSESRMVSRFLLPHPPAHTPASCIPRFFLSSLLSPCACACVACARLRRAGVLDRTRATWQLPWPATPTTACNS